MIPLDDYVVDTLMRDLVGHDHRPVSFLVYFGSLRNSGGEIIQSGSAMRI